MQTKERPSLGIESAWEASFSKRSVEPLVATVKVMKSGELFDDLNRFIWAYAIRKQT